MSQTFASILSQMLIVFIMECVTKIPMMRISGNASLVYMGNMEDTTADYHYLISLVLTPITKPA